ncbi:phosphotransferase [Pseudofrankia sp. BMG5.37]|uniref:phosphotransferase family protein n=1 Tax=Pseudofrankia sp. BMG5.37 TaxID=3050035 RepID=UPI002896096C|nr:phosphotransferase [Pseudofrankia sp. BMG5.37]MDT3445819.1 phosphotransferase [Pseudofrankia sp. BMG5.37]
MAGPDDGRANGQTLAAPLDVSAARRVLVDACGLAGLDPGDAGLMRLGEHAVFRLAAAPVVVRIGRSVAYLEAARRELVISEWLTTGGVPVVQVARLAAAQPLVIDGRVVTFWAAAGTGDDYGSAVELAEILRRLHGLAAPGGLVLPDLDPFARADARIRASTRLASEDRRFLLDRVTELRERYAGLSFALPVGPVHGDANVGNVLRNESGRAVLIDLDGFARGPREWDLLLTAMYADSYGWHSAEEYRAFVDCYGFDIMAWDGYPVLRDVRETTMVIWVGQNVGAEPRAAAEFVKRMAALRSGGSRRNWAPL